MDKGKTSYIAASSFPWKLARDVDALGKICSGFVPAIHLQVYPTNKCNLSCPYCSCAKRDRGLELAVEKAEEVANDCKELGVKAVTFSGGGEPLMHRRINSIVSLFWGMESGMATNGILAARNIETIKQLRWCRVSLSNVQLVSDLVKNGFQDAVDECKIDWAFSYVLNGNLNAENLIDCVEFAHENKFTHVRIVSDIVAGTNDIADAVDALKGIDDSIVIYQGRKEHGDGSERCHISLLKPLIGPDGKIYPCCGIQYAHNPPSLDLPANLAFDGRLSDYINNQIRFNGSDCVRCYYNNYNEMIDGIMKEYAHEKFV